MGGARQSKAYHRREEQAREQRIAQRVLLVAAGVLIAAAIVVAIGIVVTIVLPPRAHVLTVGNRSFTARDVAHRAEFALIGGDSTVLSDPATNTVTALTREETLLQVGATLVDPVTDDDLKAEIRSRLGIADSATAEQFAEGYQSFLRGIPISQAAFERLSRAQLIQDRLLAKFTAEVAASGLQYHLEAVQAASKSTMQTFHDAVVNGGDFGMEAVALHLVKAPGDVDLGWALPENLGEVSDAVKALQAGGFTDVLPIQSGTAYAIFRLVETQDDRPYDDTQRATLANAQLNTWMDQQRDPLHVSVDLSKREQSWISARVQKASKQTAGFPALPSDVPTSTPTPTATADASATPDASSTPAAGESSTATPAATTTATATATASP